MGLPLTKKDFFGGVDYLYGVDFDPEIGASAFQKKDKKLGHAAIVLYVFKHDVKDDEN